MPRHRARTSGAPPRYMADAANEGPSGIERAATVAAAALGLVGYLYALGGIVVWLRVQTAQLSPDGAIVAVDPRHLLTVGAKVVAFELFLLLAISAIVTGLVALAIVRRGPRTRPAYRQFAAFKVAWNDKATLVGFIGPELGLLLIAVGLSVDGSARLRAGLAIGGAVLGGLALLSMIIRVAPATEESVFSGVRTALSDLGEKVGPEALRLAAAALLVVAGVIGIFLLPILQGTILLAGTTMVYVGPLVSWPGTHDFGTFRRQLLLSSGVWTAIAASTAVALAWVATPPVEFPRADVSALDESHPDAGAYLNRGDGGVYLGICEPVAGDLSRSTDARIRLVPSEQSARLEIGRGTYEFDPGSRPSIWQAVKGIVGNRAVATHDAPLHHALRGEAAHVCGSS